MERPTLRERMLADIANKPIENHSWWTAEHEAKFQLAVDTIEYDLARHKYKWGECICPVSRYNIEQRWWEDPDA